MKVKNSKFRKRLLIAGLAFGVAGWSFLAWGYKENNQITGTKIQSEKESVEQVPTGSTNNIDSSIQSFLIRWMVSNEKSLKTLIIENFDSVDGYYVYPVNVVSLGKLVKLNLGLSQVEVPQQNVTAYQGFMDSITNLKKDSNGMAIVRYNKNNIASVDIYQLDYKFELIREGILKANLTDGLKEESKPVEKEEKTYVNLTAEDWRGMSLLTSRDINNKEMSPIFVVPNTSLSSQAGDFEGDFYYIVAGTLEKSSKVKTNLKSYEGKSISLDFGLDEAEAKEHYGKPVWLHLITEKGVVKNLEIQSFDKANIKAMSEGMISFINTNYIMENSIK